MATMFDAGANQKRLLNDALNNVKKHAFNLKRGIDGNDLDETLKHATFMIQELRATELSPTTYYELWMAVFDQLRNLYEYFVSLNQNGTQMVELYEQVQYSANVVPRLYLLITVGVVYISSKEAPTKEVLKDLVEMSKGVQHPMRGLFLRNYLSQMTKDKMPDVNSEFESDVNGSVEDAIEFILLNFAEMNRLWVRLQHQGKSKDRKKREDDRQQLRLLVGTNLVRLSQLEGVTLEVYQATVLPRILEEVINCKDVLAQQYLMDCIIQVFPDEFHLQTLETFLETCLELQPQVDINAIFITLMDRISNYATDGGSRESIIPESIPAFSLFNEYAAKCLEIREGLPLAAKLQLQIGILTFSINCYFDKLENIDYVLGVSSTLVSNQMKEDVEEEGDDTNHLKADARDSILELLLTPLDVISVNALSLSQYPELMKHLAWKQRVQLASKLLQAVLDSSLKVDSPEMAENLLGFLSPLIKDDVDTPSFEDEGRSLVAEFENQQHMVARLVHRMNAAKDDEYLKTQFKILGVARKHFGKGGLNRIKHTLPPLCFKYLELSRTTALAGAESRREIDSRNSGASTEMNQQDIVESKDANSKEEDKNEQDASSQEKSEDSEDEGENEQTASDKAGDNDQETKDKTEASKSDDEDEPKSTDAEDDSEVNPPAENEREKIEKTAPETSPAEKNDAPERSLEELESLVKACTAGSRKVFQYVHEIITALAGVITYQEVAMKLFLQAASCADSLELVEETVSYEFFVQAFTLYEDVADSKAQLRLLPVLIGAVQTTKGFGQDNYETLCTKVTQYAARLLKKPDQCRMVYSCSHLFWDDSQEVVSKIKPAESTSSSLGDLLGDSGGDKTDVFGDGKRALECLQKSLRIADACVSSSAHISLFIEILNRYVFFFDKGCTKITAQYISGLIALINEHLSQLSEDEHLELKTQLEKFFRSTLEHIKVKARTSPGKYADIDLG